MRIVTYAPFLEPPSLEALAGALASRGIELVPAALEPAPDGDAATAVLSKRLVEWESLLEAEAPGALLLGGDDDTALAGALSAAKLELPVIAIAADRIVVLLAALALEVADAERAASEIAAWAEALPTLPAR